MQAHHIPIELKVLRQWLCYELIWNEKRQQYDKPPKSPHDGKAGSSTDSQTWGTFEEAIAGAAKHHLEGVGFVFTEQDPYCGVDLDEMIDPEIGEIAPEAEPIIQELNSYTEVSVSGTGVHIIVRGTLPPGRRRQTESHIEMYDCGRFFTMSGNLLPGAPATIASRDAELAALHWRIFGKPVSGYPGTHRATYPLASDQELLDRMFASKNGGKVQALWAGDASGHGSHSEAALALCLHLAYWAQGDEAAVDRLFRQSGLMRDKWERADYRERTIGESVKHINSVQCVQSVPIDPLFALFSYNPLKTLNRVFANPTWSLYNLFIYNELPYGE